MKNFFTLFFIFIAITGYSQTNTLVFELTDGERKFNSKECLTEKTAFNSLELALVKGDLATMKSFIATISLSDNSKRTFNTYDQLRSTNLLSWLEENNAFKQFKSIKYSLKIVLTSNKKESQVIEICLKDVEEEIKAEIIAKRRIELEQKQKTRSIVNARKIAEIKEKGTKEFIEIPVSFATDRNDTRNSDLNERFGGKRAEIQYGRAVVSIPYVHKLGEIERPSYWRLEFSEDPKKHVVLQSLKKQSKDVFFNQMKQRIAKNGKTTFLFVHGYNVSFADAAMRTAQITFDLQFDGEPVFYSWPSQASTTSYTVDEANIEWAKLNMKNFLRDYLTKTEADNIYLVAHSMGNRGLTQALIDLMNENPELKHKITEIILAAPDIDADVFKRDIAPQMVKKIGKPITLYVSSDDLALIASRKVHGNKRAGDAGKGVVIVKGVETIDASGVDTSFLSHSYFATTSTIIEDILDLMKSGKRAQYRETLERISRENVIYWKVKQNKN